MTQHGVLLLLGAYVLQVALTDAHLAYVQAGFRPFLLIAAVVLLGVALLGLLRAWRARQRDGDGVPAHEHGAPRVSWLLVLPAVVLALVAPPALGSFTVARQTQPAQLTADTLAAPALGPDDPGRDHRTVPVMTYRLAALAPDASTLEGRRIRLTGFVTPREGGGWYVSRIAIACCAADAVGITVVVDGERGGLAADQWVEVIGTWAPPVRHPAGDYPEAVIDPVSVRPIEPPADTYED
ncbi:TIGR03943 family putative permease subunit [Blastococcus montanus]|uniref:TIGR03943 family putative permease subunit n=1 Tax=Blastococcus montanus TaxID=3144973 RepID=UPI00320AF6A3